MTQPHLIIVAGPSAAGKTTLARQIAGGLRLALICKDTIKEQLFDHLGSGDRDRSRQLGSAAVQCIYALAEDSLRSGASVVIESTFTHRDSPGELQALAERGRARLSVLFCYATPEALSERYNARVKERHPGHRDTATVTPQDVVADGWLCRPDYPERVLTVDTSDFAQVSLNRILAWLCGGCPDTCQSSD
jgi:predicted kinase